MAIQENTNFKKQNTKEQVMVISDYLEPDLIEFLEVKTQLEALTTLVNVLDREGKLSNKEEFFLAILQREKVVSTGIGVGVAIPHAKLPGYEDFFMTIGIQKKEGIEWQALDGLPVRLIIMIGGPDNRQTEYLNILSMLTAAIKDEGRRKKLIQAKTSDEVIALFEGV